MPRSRPPRPSWPPVIVCGLAVAYAAVVVALSAVNAPIPPPQINSIVAGAFAAAAVIVIVLAVTRRALSEVRRELRELRELVAPEESAEGLGPDAIAALRRMDRRLGDRE